MNFKIVVGRKLGNGLDQGGVFENVLRDSLGLADKALFMVNGFEGKGRTVGKETLSL